MPVLNTDIIYNASTGTDIVNGTSNLGGIIDTTTELVSGSLHNLFDAVDAGLAYSGGADYRCFYVRSTAPTDTLTAAKLYVEVPPGSSDITITVGLGSSGLNGTEQTIANDLLAPPGVSFVAANSTATAIVMGDLAPSAFYPIWVKRTVSVGATALASDTFTLTTFGETA